MPHQDQPDARPAPQRTFPGSPGRRVFRAAVAFVGVVLVVDALFGRQGLVEAWRARRQREALTSAIAHLERENARLRAEARRLREDPGTLEALARRELGLIKPGELMFIIKDVPLAARPEHSSVR